LNQVFLTLRIILFSLLMSSSLLASQTRDWQSKQAADKFTHTASTALAPVYGYMANYLASRFGLERTVGTGVDLGGGPGHLCVELALRSPSMRWIDADINSHFFTHLTKLADSAGVGNRVEGVRADATDLPFPDQSASFIVSRGSLQFWDDLDRAISEINRVLEPGGTAFIGRGLPPNMPADIARQVRLAQNGGPSYDIDATEVQLLEAIKKLGIEKFEIIRPTPQGADDLNYGIWLEFSKDALETSLIFGNRSAYAMDTLIFRGEPPRDPLTRPNSEPVGLQNTTTVVRAEDISRQGASTLIEALEYVPGAWVETRGRKVKQFFSVRGQRYPYPDYALDGAWQREFHELPYSFPASDIERVEVMRSSAALLKGLAGMNGVVDIRLRRLDHGETTASVEYGSFGSYGLSLSHGGSLGNAGYTFSFGAPHTEGPGGRNAGEGVKHFRGSFYWNPSSDLSVTTHVLHLDGYRQLANAKAPASNRFRNSLEEFDPFKASLITVNTVYSPSGRATSELTLNFADRDHTFINAASEPHASNSEHDYEWSANFTQSIALTANNVLRFGGLYNHWVAPNGKRFYAGRRSDLETYSAVVVDEHEFGRLTVDAGLRWARTWINQYGAFNINGSPKGLANVNPVNDQWEPSVLTTNVGASWRLEHGVSLLANISRGNIKPRSGELDVDFRKPATEKRTKLDFGLAYSGQGMSHLHVAGFYVCQDEAIVLSGQTETVEGRTLELYLNRDQNQLGLEIDARSMVIGGHFQVFGNLTAMRSRADSNGEMVTNGELPKFISSAGLYYASGALDATVLWKYVSAYKNARFAASGQPEPLADFHDIGLTAGYTFGSAPSMRCYLEARNLGDDHYSTVVGYPDYGRRYTVGIQATFY
jgi:outer membrane cobalamin receptor/SAM-dependent methyltransferase